MTRHEPLDPDAGVAAPNWLGTVDETPAEASVPSPPPIRRDHEVPAITGELSGPPSTPYVPEFAPMVRSSKPRFAARSGHGARLSPVATKARGGTVVTFPPKSAPGWQDAATMGGRTIDPDPPHGTPPADQGPWFEPTDLSFESAPAAAPPQPGLPSPESQPPSLWPDLAVDDHNAGVDPFDPMSQVTSDVEVRPREPDHPEESGRGFEWGIDLGPAEPDRSQQVFAAETADIGRIPPLPTERDAGDEAAIDGELPSVAVAGDEAAIDGELPLFAVERVDRGRQVQPFESDEELDALLAELSAISAEPDDAEPPGEPGLDPTPPDPLSLEPAGDSGPRLEPQHTPTGDRPSGRPGSAGIGPDVFAAETSVLPAVRTRRGDVVIEGHRATDYRPRSGRSTPPSPPPTEPPQWSVGSVELNTRRIGLILASLAVLVAVAVILLQPFG